MGCGSVWPPVLGRTYEKMMSQARLNIITLGRVWSDMLIGKEPGTVILTRKEYT